MTTQTLSRNFFICIIFLLGLILLVIYLDIKPLYSQFKKVNNLENQLRTQFSEDMNLIRQMNNIQIQLGELSSKVMPYLRNNPDNVTAELLASILQTAEIEGLMVESVKPSEWKSLSEVNRIFLHLTAIGEFMQFAGFIAHLSQSSLPILLTNFSLLADQNGLIKIDMQLMGMYIKSENNSFSQNNFYQSASRIKKNLISAINSTNSTNSTKSTKSIYHEPFSGLENSVVLTNIPANHASLLQSVSVQQIKWVGYVHDDQQWVALAMLPNGETIAIKQGARVGVENAKITHLTEQQIVLNINESGHLLKLKYL